MEKTLHGFKQAFTGWPGLSAFAAALLLTPSARAMLMFFGFFLLMDYATGILASWTEHRKRMDNGRSAMDSDGGKADGDPPLGGQGGFFVSSARLRESFAKVFGYMLVIAFAAFLDFAFFHGGVHLPGVHLPGADRPPMTAAEIAIAGCTAVELLSNLENLKRAGFDLPGKLHSAMDSAWRTVRKARGEGS